MHRAVRPLAAILLVLAGSFGFAAIDPPAVLAGLVVPGPVTVQQAPPDLTVTKTNNVGGVTTAGSTWTWTFAIRNQGAGPATFTAGQSVLLDNLPNANVSYPSVFSTPFGAPSGTLACAVDGQSNLTCQASGGSVVIPAGSGYDVTMQSTTLIPGTYVDPRPAGICQVDPSLNVPESNESNNTCGDTVTVVGPDLTVVKTNNVGGTATVGAPWTWTITISNAGDVPATFTSGQRILQDALPNTSVTYSGLAVAAFGGALPNLNCTIDGQSNLACLATAGDAIIPVNGGYTIAFQAVGSTPAVYANPRAANGCLVDPDGTIGENSEANNACANTVTIPAPDLTATKSNDVGGTGTVGVPWTWRVLIANTSGTAPATFANTQRVLLDNLPNVTITYGTPTVTPNGGATGTLTCTIDGSANLLCVANGAVTVPVGGAFDVSFTATPSASGSFANPRPGGVCQIDPDNVVLELDNANNICTDSVGVGLPGVPDLRVTKTNSVGGGAAVGLPFTWAMIVANHGAGDASFTASQTILLDDLPDASFSYGPPSVTSVSNVTGSANIACAIVSSTLTCTATGAVTIGPGGSFGLSFVATPGAVGTYANPRTGGSCAVDPNNNVAESTENNNACIDSIVVTATPQSPQPVPVPPVAQVAPPGAPEAPQAVAENKQDDDDDDVRPLTQAERLQRERTNTAGEGDYRTEGFVVEVRCDTSTPPQTDVSFPDDTPYLVIATMDGEQQLRLLHDTRSQCQSVQVGDYAEADGEKQHEHLFDAHDLEMSRQ